MQILFISDNFPPEVNAPASRTYEHAKRWVAEGASVTVVTCAPNFPKGEVHPGYRNAWRSVEYVDGIRVVRVKSYITGNEGFGKRILDYASFMASAVFFGVFEKRPDVVVGTSPQFFSAVAAWLLSVIKWRPFVFELRDLWPASIVTVGAMKKGLVIRLLEGLELFLYRRAAMVVSVTESFREDLASRGINSAKVSVVRNGVDLARFVARVPSRELAENWGLADKFVVAYLGTHGMAHDLANVLEAARILAHRQSIAFLLVGDGAEKSRLVARGKEMGLENVVFRDSVPKEMMPEVWSICDLALVHLKGDPVFSTVIPSKIFEAFGMGKPVLLVQPQGEAGRLVLGHGAGVWVPPSDPQALADTVLALASNRQRVAELAKGAEAAAPEHSRDALASAMLGLLAECSRTT